jgi:hypothetical protein
MSVPPIPTPEESDSVLAELLSAHADALIAGRPFATPSRADAAPLLELATRLSEALVPVDPDTAFFTRLKAELLAVPLPTTPTLSTRWRSLPARTRFVARVGGLTITAGLALFAGIRALDALRSGRREASAAKPSLLTSTS